MASYYKFKGDPEEARQAVHDVKEKLKPGILKDALDKLEKDGEIDLPALADERNVDPAVYAHPTKQKIFNTDLKDYLEPGYSPFRASSKKLDKKKINPKSDIDIEENPDGEISLKSKKPPKIDYPNNFEIIENPDGTIEIKDKEASKPLPVTKDTSLFDKKTTITKSIKFPSETGWSDSKKEEGNKLKKEWRFSLVKKGILTYDKVYAKFKIVPERISDYKKELQKYIPQFEKQMSSVNENKTKMKKTEFKKFIREEIKRTLKEDQVDETTVVDKTTDINKVNDIARQEKKDPNTIKSAISQAKMSGKPITVAELEFPDKSYDAEISQNARKAAKDQLDKDQSMSTKQEGDDKKVKSILSNVKDDIDSAPSLDAAKSIIQNLIDSMDMKNDKRLKGEYIMLRSLLDDKSLNRFISHFYNLLLKFEKLGSPDTKPKRDGSFAGGEYGNDKPAPSSRGGQGGNVSDIGDFLKQHGF